MKKNVCFMAALSLIAFTAAWAQTAEEFMQRGNSYYNSGDFERAVAEYTQALRLERSVAVYINRGNAYLSTKDYDRAISDYTLAIRLNPQNETAYINRGIAYSIRPHANALADADLAIADYEAALRIKPNHTDARANLAAAKNWKAAETDKKKQQDDAWNAIFSDAFQRVYGGSGSAPAPASGSDSAQSQRVSQHSYQIAYRFWVLENGKRKDYEGQEIDVRAGSEGEARRKVQDAIYSKYPGANDFVITKFYRVF